MRFPVIYIKLVAKSFHKLYSVNYEFYKIQHRRSYGCCTAMWKAHGKTTTLSLFLDSLFPKTEIPCMRDAWRQERILSFEGGSSRSH